MRKILVVGLFMMLFSTPLFGATWCTWSGTEGENCQSDDKGYLRGETHPIGPPEANYNYHGWYERIITQPTIGADQVRDAEIWGFAANKITLTWAVRDLTATEIDERIANPMSIEMYYVWRALTHPTLGILTQQQAAQALPQEMVDAFLARKRLLGD